MNCEEINDTVFERKAKALDLDVELRSLKGARTLHYGLLSGQKVIVHVQW